MTAPLAADRDAVLRAPEGRLLTAATTASRAVLVVALLAGLAVPDALEQAGPALLVLAAVLGLPHGAVDHLAWGWSRGQAGRPRPRVVVLYAAAAALAVGAALLAPVPALLVLLALSAAHFAEGEAAWGRLRAGRAGACWPAAAAAGLASVSLPVLLRPEQVRPLLEGLDPALPGVLLRDGVRVPLLALTAALVLAGALAARRDRSRLAELALVVAVAAVLPPLAAFAAWFAGWHAVRHTARLVSLDPRSTAELAAGRVGPPLRRFARDAVLPSAAALLGTLALAALTGLTGGLLVALLALTVPHTAVVARLGAGRPAPTRADPV